MCSAALRIRLQCKADPDPDPESKKLIERKIVEIISSHEIVCLFYRLITELTFKNKS